METMGKDAILFIGKGRMNDMQKCHDCGVGVGELHSPGCDDERCPFCLGQLISCDCHWEMLGIDPDEEPFYSKGLNNEQAKKWNEMLQVKGLIPYDGM